MLQAEESALGDLSEGREFPFLIFSRLAPREVLMDFLWEAQAGIKGHSLHRALRAQIKGYSESFISRPI